MGSPHHAQARFRARAKFDLLVEVSRQHAHGAASDAELGQAAISYARAAEEPTRAEERTGR